MPVAPVDVQDMVLSVEDEDVWACLGSRDRSVPGLVGDIERGIALCDTLCRPRGVYARLTVEEVGRNRVSFADGPTLEGKFLAHCFEGADEAIFLVATIGAGLESRVSRLFAEGNSVEAVVLDAVGSAAVMNVFGQMANDIFQEATDRGWQTGLCLRPGQSYWDIVGQRAVFQVLAAESIGVELLESCFMAPQKSQSAVIPLGPSLKVHGDPNQYYCRHCQATRCPMRQEPEERA